MIQTHSLDPDVSAAADTALQLITETLAALPTASRFDYGGHLLNIGDYDVCSTCTTPIAEAQLAQQALLSVQTSIDDPVVSEHIALAAKLFELEAEAAVIRAEFHNGSGTEKILDYLLGYSYGRNVHDSYEHSHRKGE